MRLLPRISRYLLPLLAGLIQTCHADAARYPDGHGGTVAFPLGDASFADQVTHYTSGDPAPHQPARDPAAALGIPDIAEHDNGGYTTLGCGGELILSFADNALIDVPGPDLYVFEIGPDVEPTALAVSSDGKDWVRVGRISGGKSEIDLAPYVAGEREFRQVRLVDLKSACSSAKTPGADIDAVGAIGSATRITLDSAVLFDSGQHTLKPGAFAAIDEALDNTPNMDQARITIAGHTDAVGSAEANQTLSYQRADSMARYLTVQRGIANDRVTREAWGESQPVADNDTAAGRARNRRVELTLRAPRPRAQQPGPGIEILGIWDANKHGILELRREGRTTTGDYTTDSGKLRGKFVSETVFEGYWIENHSRQKCDSRKAGSDHWGPLRMEFETAARDRFTARWRYCGETQWRGQWQTGHRLL